MSEVVYEHPHPVILNNTNYRVLVNGTARADGTWSGCIEFVSGTTRLRTGQETSQPSREALVYWATGLEDRLARSC